MIISIKVQYNGMTQRRNRSNSDKTSSLCITMPSNLLDQINDKINNDVEYGSRSDFLEKAAVFLLSARECPYCHELTGPGNYCSYCRRDMTFTPAERSVAMELYLAQHPEHISNEERIIHVHLNNSEIRKLLDGEEIPEASFVKEIDRKIFKERITKMYREKRQKTSIGNETTDIDKLSDDEISSIGDF